MKDLFVLLISLVLISPTKAQSLRTVTGVERYDRFLTQPPSVDESASRHPEVFELYSQRASEFLRRLELRRFETQGLAPSGFLTQENVLLSQMYLKAHGNDSYRRALNQSLSESDYLEKMMAAKFYSSIGTAAEKTFAHDLFQVLLIKFPSQKLRDLGQIGAREVRSCRHAVGSTDSQ